jgi:hypothetical protein
MNMSKKLRILIVGLPLLFVATGCSSSGPGKGEQSPQEGVLQEVADLLRAGTHPSGRGPSKLSDLDRVQSIYSRSYQAIKSGSVVVLWGSGVKGEGEGATGGEVVAYEKDVPTSGGFVLLSSGHVKQMTAAEFESAPKAAKSPTGR